MARLLEENGRRLVLAESCTGGLVAATLTQVPGVSEFFCGSAVTYRNDTKHRWLDVDADSLADPGPVSETVVRQMAGGAMAATPEADLAAAVTGHLGPDAPPAQDGLVFVAVAQGRGERARVSVEEHRLPEASRLQRQRRAAQLVLAALADALSE